LAFGEIWEMICVPSLASKQFVADGQLEEFENRMKKKKKKTGVGRV
jgi:hypothetical protein